ncbi:uncharacterized transporter slc-17.2-like isoform X2 [Tigriopus californicus]|uniref:uncharacterized transporter slc-17.2-like isoform X2 n=1 Tax=Tigriopus californicus TaxID=6832 RepID=UPI0027DA5CE3|nr:uncharacterized transporter slc-17.2-like isoform X2 [Tigriopus californicus]
MESEKSPRLMCSFRLLIAFICGISFFLLFNLRFGFSMALVCMNGSGKPVDRDGNGTTTSTVLLKGEFDWDRSTQSHLLGTFFYGYILTQVVGGWVSDRFGGKITMVASMLGLGITSVLIPMAARVDPKIVMGIRFLQGCFQGAILPTAYSLIPGWGSPAERTFLMAVVMSGLVLSNVLTPAIAGSLCLSGVDGGWPMIFYIPGILCIVWTAVFFFLGSNSPEENKFISQEEQTYLQKYSCKSQNQQGQSSHPQVPWLKLFSSIPFLTLAVTHFCSAFGFYLMSLSLPFFINEIFDLGPIQNGILSGLTFVGPVIIGPVIGLLSAKIIKSNWLTVTHMRKLFTCSAQSSFAVLLICSNQVDNKLLKMSIFALINTLHQVSITGGFYISHMDLVGPFAGVAFGITNTAATCAGFLIPLFLSYFVPNDTHHQMAVTMRELSFDPVTNKQQQP